MQTYRIETTIPADGTLTITGLPFQAGDKVEIIVRGCEQEKNHSERYPLRGKMIHHTDPFESVAEDDWEAIKEEESFDVTQDPVFQMEGYDSDAPADLSTNLDKYLYGKEKPE